MSCARVKPYQECDNFYTVNTPVSTCVFGCTQILFQAQALSSGTVSLNVYAPNCGYIGGGSYVLFRVLVNNNVVASLNPGQFYQTNLNNGDVLEIRLDILPNVAITGGCTAGANICSTAQLSTSLPTPTPTPSSISQITKLLEILAILGIITVVLVVLLERYISPVV